MDKLNSLFDYCNSNNRICHFNNSNKKSPSGRLNQRKYYYEKKLNCFIDYKDYE